MIWLSCDALLQHASCHDRAATTSPVSAERLPTRQSSITETASCVASMRHLFVQVVNGGVKTGQAAAQKSAT
ncbi:MAG: hypothetical protein ACOVOA_07495, partial [Allorhizobium sp.]